jgi:hypothetical protein
MGVHDVPVASPVVKHASSQTSTALIVLVTLVVLAGAGVTVRRYTSR